MFGQWPLNSSSSAVPPYPTSTVTSQSSLEFEVIELGLESYAESEPVPNSRDWPGLPMLCQRLLNSSSSEVPPYPKSTVTNQNSLEFQDVELGLESYAESESVPNSRDWSVLPMFYQRPVPNSTDWPSLVKRLPKILSWEILRWNSKYLSPASEISQLLWMHTRGHRRNPFRRYYDQSTEPLTRTVLNSRTSN
jgi:hypothetical protein